MNNYYGRYTGTYDAFRSIVRSDGVLGLWKGWIPNCQRAAVVCLGGEGLTSGGLGTSPVAMPFREKRVYL